MLVITFYFVIAELLSVKLHFTNSILNIMYLY